MKMTWLDPPAHEITEEEWAEIQDFSSGRPCCESQSINSFLCTRHRGHEGRHLAGAEGGTIVKEAWT